MATNKTVTQETVGSAIQDADIFRAVQNGASVKFSFTQVKAWVSAKLAALTVSVLGLLATGTTGIGYDVGAGSVVVQATNKSTAVELDKPSGQITTQNTALAGGTSIVFTLTNSCIGAHDVVMVNVMSGFATGGTYTAVGESVGAGSCKIHLRNVSGGSLSEALVLQFFVFKGSIT